MYVYHTNLYICIYIGKAFALAQFPVRPRDKAREILFSLAFDQKRGKLTPVGLWAAGTGKELTGIKI